MQLSLWSKEKALFPGQCLSHAEASRSPPVRVKLSVWLEAALSSRRAVHNRHICRGLKRKERLRAGHSLEPAHRPAAPYHTLALSNNQPANTQRSRGIQIKMSHAFHKLVLPPYTKLRLQLSPEMILETDQTRNRANKQPANGFSLTHTHIHKDIHTIRR